MSTQDTWLHLLSSVAHPDTTQDKTTLLAVCPSGRMTFVGVIPEFWDLRLGQDIGH